MWNYRVLAFENSEETIFAICEVYYNEKETPNGYADPNKTISDNGIKGLRWVLNKQKGALKKPILYGGEKFPQEYQENFENKP
jgi:hypothetical protein